MKKLCMILLCAFLCARMMTGCAKDELYEEGTYRFTYNSNLWTPIHEEVNRFGIGEATRLLPTAENSFPEQRENTMNPLLTIYEYAGKSGKSAFAQHIDETYISRLQNPSYPDYTFANLTPADDMAFEMPFWFGEDDLYTIYCCAFDTSEGSIVVECEYLSDKAWNEMQKILNTLEIF